MQAYRFDVDNPCDTIAELRSRAENARKHAVGVWPHPAAEALLKWAAELDAVADSLALETRAAPHS